MIRRTKAYLVIMSNKDPVQIDEEELEKIVVASTKGGLVVCKRGVVNPSYVVDIQLDKERMREWKESCRYGFGQGEENEKKGLDQLVPIYSEGSNIRIALDKRTLELEAKLPKLIENKG